MHEVFVRVSSSREGASASASTGKARAARARGSPEGGKRHAALQWLVDLHCYWHSAAPELDADTAFRLNHDDFRHINIE